MKKMRILVADDHDFSSSSLSKHLSLNFNFEISTARNVTELLNQAKQHDVLILDMQFYQNDFAGLEVMAKLKNSKVDLKILILSYITDKYFIGKSQELGAAGYIFKNDPYNFLNDVLIDIYNGVEENYLNWSSKTIRNILVSHSAIPELEPQQKSILKFKAEGYTSKEIAAKINEGYKPKKPFVTADIDFFLRAVAKEWKIKNDKAAIVAKAIQNLSIDIDDLNFIEG